MGFVIKPIPREIWLMLTPEERMKLYRSERAFYTGVYARQGDTMGLGLIVIAALVILAAVYFL